MMKIQLNKAQEEAVKLTDGPVMILAGAGSGKTRTLISRIIYLLQEKKVPPYKILALTFSNKAAKEMRERITRRMEEGIESLQISTFHSFCAWVLRQKADYLGLSRSFTIYDTAESKAVIRDILLQYGINLKEQPPFEVLSYINSIKDKGYYPGRKKGGEDIDKNDIFYSFYRDYEVLLAKANALDFGGLIAGVLQLFEKFPQALQYYQNRFDYVLIDEYQDTNRAQFELLSMLCAKNRNICVVGDEDQSIYSWRGADINNILDFERVFPDMRLIKLEQNYRSSQVIIEAAGCVIEKNSQRKGKKLWTENEKGDDISLVECSQDDKEAEFITEQVLFLANRQVNYRDMAVFYRTNIQSRLIEDYLRRQNIPYRVVGGIKFYERKEIKDLMAYMKLVINGKDMLA
ncbi:MAG: UvrD-helicase domain-containing protein, partial [Halobacteriovoraceae bacterium]|nr:UvrD-helicase domain-containing protein [Halobacteriovoraceae bacterium]